MLKTELLKSALILSTTNPLYLNTRRSPRSIATPEKILEFVKEINDDHFKICLDTGHVSVFSELSIGNEIRKLGDYIRVLHIHDNMVV